MIIVGVSHPIPHFERTEFGVLGGIVWFWGSGRLECDELFDDTGDIVGLVLLEGVLTRGLEDVVIVGEDGAPNTGEWLFE